MPVNATVCQSILILQWMNVFVSHALASQPSSTTTIAPSWLELTWILNNQKTTTTNKYHHPSPTTIMFGNNYFVFFYSSPFYYLSNEKKKTGKKYEKKYWISPFAWIIISWLEIQTETPICNNFNFFSKEIGFSDISEQVFSFLWLKETTLEFSKEVKKRR